MSLLLGANSAGSSPIAVFGLAVPRQVARWFAGVWISVVIVGSLMPGSAKITLHTRDTKRSHVRNGVTIQHRLIHFIAFGSSFLVLSVLATRRRELLEAAAEVLAIGCIVEVIQFFVYSHRHTFEWWDIRDDAIGIAVAFLLVEIAINALPSQSTSVLRGP